MIPCKYNPTQSGEYADVAYSQPDSAAAARENVALAQERISMLAIILLVWPTTNQGLYASKKDRLRKSMESRLGSKRLSSWKQYCSPYFSIHYHQRHDLKDDLDGTLFQSWARLARVKTAFAGLCDMTIVSEDRRG